jgi:oligopeptidase B
MRPNFSSPVAASPPAEPQAEQRPLERTLHDLRLIDEYAWLKAENWREVMRDPFQLNPAIRAYLQAENDYCERALADTKTLQETLFAEMKDRIKEDDSSAPNPDGLTPTTCAIARRGSTRYCAGSRAIPRTSLPRKRQM